MKKLLTLTLLFLVSGIAFSQIDSIKFSIDGRDFLLTPKRITNKRDLDNHVPQYPFFIFSDDEGRKVKVLLPNTSMQASAYDTLLAKMRNLEVLYKEKDNTTTFIIDKEKQRAELYQKAYESLVSINNGLNEQLKICTDIARKEAKYANNKGVIYGVLGGLVAGLVTGVVISR